MLVLCEVADLSALWAAGRLQARGVPVDIVTASVLGSALRWDHRLSKDGDASVAIDLGDGRTITNRDNVGVLNRLAFAPTDRRSITALVNSCANSGTPSLRVMIS